MNNNLDSFIDSWGAMGSLWGLNASIARIHALLIATSKPWTLDEIAERLQISKSNASMSLKELRSWGVIRKVLQQGDRREFFECEPDAWKMLFSIMRERKKREFDPIVASVRHAVAGAKEEPNGLALDRLKQMEQMLATFDQLANRLLASEKQARTLISFLIEKG